MAKEVSCDHAEMQPFASESLAHPGIVDGVVFTLGKCMNCRVNVLRAHNQKTGQNVVAALDPDDYEELWSAESREERLERANALWHKRKKTL